MRPVRAHRHTRATRSQTGVFMRKKLKIVFIVCSVALVLFLLLPFLAPDSAKNTSAAKAGAKAEAQIFTSNPLTELVGRIARFFRARQNADEQNRPVSTATADEMFSTPAEGTLYASANNTTPAAFAGTSPAADYLPEEDGDWVLIRQTAPAGSTRGMHEINVKDNAYDRYVAQERQARFTPVMRQPAAKKEVPDSRLARLFSPIKHLFGSGEQPAASGALRADASGSTLASAKRSSSGGLNKNKDKSARPFKARAAGWDAVSNNPFSSLTPASAEAAQAFANLIDPSYEIDRTAEWLADLKYPDAATDPAAQQAKQEFTEKITRQKTEQTNREMQELMIRRNAGQGPVNVLENTFGCGDGSVSKANECSISPQEDQRPAVDLNALQQANAQRFLEQTGYTLPPSGITVILNSSDLPVLDEDIQEELLEEMPAGKSQTAKLYLFMQDQCQDNCYWVATGADQNSELANTIKGAGLTFKGDPFNRYPQYMQNFLEEKRQEGKTEEEIKEIKQQLEENKPQYVAYSEQDIYRLAQDSKHLMRQQAAPEEATVPFFTHVQNAYDFYQRTNYPRPLLYGNGSAVDGDKELAERTEDLTNELAQFVNDAQEIRKKAKSELTEEGAQALAEPAMQQIQQRLKDDMENFTKNNDVGTYKK